VIHVRHRRLALNPSERGVRVSTRITSTTRLPGGGWHSIRHGVLALPESRFVRSSETLRQSGFDLNPKIEALT
jgi:hypothetical protein